MKSKYWSCSKFANWLRGTPKPSLGTAEEWSTWKETAKIKKIRYWLAEEGLDYLQDFIRWPANCINDMRCYVRNRWIIKSHALNSNLKRGQWYDLDTRLLYAAFDELINFVEIEQAGMFVALSKKERRKYKTPWYHTIFPINLWRYPEAGIACLEWAAKLKKDEDWVDKNDPSFGQPTFQALAAQEILALYKWWKQERPKRLNLSEASGWSEYCKENRQISEAHGDDSHSILDIYYKMEKEQEDEDTAMLIRLVNIRKSLWT